MKKLLYILGYAILFLSCNRLSNDFSESPSQRTKAHLEALKAKLSDPSLSAWQMIYFPNVDNFLFVDYSQLWRHTLVNETRYGLGGHVFFVKFNKDNKVEIKSLGSEAKEERSESEYSLSLNTNIQLSFTTYSAIHAIINKETEALADFLYQYEDFEGNMIFTTSKDSFNKRSMMILRPIKDEKIWQTSLLEKVEKHRRVFESMENPQLLLRQGARVFFASDLFFTEETRKKLVDRRYHTFIYVQKEFKGEIIKGYNVLGSGYVPTLEGLSFQPGFRIEKDFIIRDFELVEEMEGSKKKYKFVAELVEVYNPDPLQRTFINGSKHMYPGKEFNDLNYYAEIKDVPIK